MKTMEIAKHATPSRLVNILFLIAAVCCVVYYLALGIGVRFGQSLDFMWLVLAFAFLARFILVGRMIRSGEAALLPSFLIKLIFRNTRKIPLCNFIYKNIRFFYIYKIFVKIVIQ